MTKIIQRPGVLGHLQEDINRLFEPFGWVTDKELSDVFISDWSPRIDIKDESNQYVIRADIPGVDPKDVDIHMEHNILTIKGQKESKKEETSKDYVRVERSKGSFLRRFSLPESVDAEKIEAKSKHGVLEILLPKIERAKSRKISVEEKQ